MNKTAIKRLSQRVFAQAQVHLPIAGFACHALNIASNGTISHDSPEALYFCAVLKPRNRIEAGGANRELMYKRTPYWRSTQFYGERFHERNEHARSFGLALVALLAKEGFVP